MGAANACSLSPPSLHGFEVEARRTASPPRGHLFVSGQDQMMAGLLLERLTSSAVGLTKDVLNGPSGFSVEDDLARLHRGKSGSPARGPGTFRGPRSLSPLERKRVSLEEPPNFPCYDDSHFLSIRASLTSDASCPAGLGDEVLPSSTYGQDQALAVEIASESLRASREGQREHGLVLEQSDSRDRVLSREWVSSATFSRAWNESSLLSQVPGSQADDNSLYDTYPLFTYTWRKATSSIAVSETTTRAPSEAQTKSIRRARQISGHLQPRATRHKHPQTSDCRSSLQAQRHTQGQLAKPGRQQPDERFRSVHDQVLNSLAAAYACPIPQADQAILVVGRSKPLGEELSLSNFHCPYPACRSTLQSGAYWVRNWSDPSDLSTLHPDGSDDLTHKTDGLMCVHDGCLECFVDGSEWRAHVLVAHHDLLETHCAEAEDGRSAGNKQEGSMKGVDAVDERVESDVVRSSNEKMQRDLKAKNLMNDWTEEFICHGGS